MYTMKQVCEMTNMTYETLKFYCNQGLVPNVKRDANNRRIFDEHDVMWINSLSCLKNCNMSIPEMKHYIDLVIAGNDTLPERKEILDKKRTELLEMIDALNSSIDYIDWKQELYDHMLSGKAEMFTKPQPTVKSSKVRSS